MQGQVIYTQECNNLEAMQTVFYTLHLSACTLHTKLHQFLSNCALIYDIKMVSHTSHHRNVTCVTNLLCCFCAKSK